MHALFSNAVVQSQTVHISIPLWTVCIRSSWANLLYDVVYIQTAYNIIGHTILYTSLAYTISFIAIYFLWSIYIFSSTTLLYTIVCHLCIQSLPGRGNSYPAAHFGLGPLMSYMLQARAKRFNFTYAAGKEWEGVVLPQQIALAPAMAINYKEHH